MLLSLQLHRLDENSNLNRNTNNGQVCTYFVHTNNTQCTYYYYDTAVNNVS